MNNVSAFVSTATLILIISIITGCARPTSAEAVPDSKLPFTIIEQGNHSGFTLAKQLIITDAPMWESLYAIHKPAERSRPPVINFMTHTVIAIFIGEQYTGGYAVTISSLEQQPNKLLVHFVITAPKPGQTTTMALTQPFTMITTARVPSPIVFVQHTALTP